MRSVLIFAVSFLFSPPLWAASCCGGGFSIPALILGDDKAQLTGTYSYSQVSDDVLADGRWLRRKDENLAQTLKLEGATLLTDSVQAGFSLPILSKTAANLSQSSGLGDASLYLGHETFPERTYSEYRPKGVTFLQLTLPTSPSIYDESATSPNTIRGRGFYALGAGFALIKSFPVWDFNTSSEIHRSFPRAAQGPAYGGNATITPGCGFSVNSGAGWNRGPLRLGSFLTFLFEEAVQSQGLTVSEGQVQKNFTIGALASYMPNMETSITFSYADQSLIGNPVNSSLTKTFNLSYQQRWPR